MLQFSKTIKAAVANCSEAKTFCAIICCMMFSATILVAQTAYQPGGLVKKTIKGIQIDLASVTLKDNEGHILDLPTVSSMLQSGKYSMETYVDEQDNVKEIVLREGGGAVPFTVNRQAPESALKEELEKLRVRDQALRSLIMRGGCIEQTYGANSEESKYLWQLIAQEDKKNQEQAVKIIEENGWPGISQVGFMANNALFLVIQHAPAEIQEKYFPLLKESAEKGESRLADMALMDDRIRMRRKMKQLYGSQTTTIDGKNYVWPIEDAKNVDERRKSVQLQPLADYLNQMGLSYPQDELPPELF
jgi:hypothetical protein